MDADAHRKAAAPAAQRTAKAALGAVQEADRSALDNRVQQLRKAYQRRLAKKPTIIESGTMAMTAKLVARAELAVDDPHIGINDLVRIRRVAREAEQALEAMFAKIEAEADSESSLSLAELLGP